MTTLQILGFVMLLVGGFVLGGLTDGKTDKLVLVLLGSLLLIIGTHLVQP